MDKMEKSRMEKLVEELKEKGDSRWIDLQLLMAREDNVEIETPLGRLCAISTASGDEIWIDINTEDGENLSVAHVSVDEQEDGTFDIVSRLWIGSQDDYVYKNNHEILQQMNLETED